MASNYDIRIRTIEWGNFQSLPHFLTFKSRIMYQIRHDLSYKMFLWINEERAKYGLYPFVYSKDLQKVGVAHSKNQQNEKAVFHEYQGENVGHRINKNQNIPRFITAGENVGWSLDSTDHKSLLFVHNGFLGSPNHRDNLMVNNSHNSPKFTHIGIGITRTPKGILYVTQVFARF